MKFEYYVGGTRKWMFDAYNINIIYPINYTFGIDGGADTVQISMYIDPTLYNRLRVDLPIKITNGNSVDYFVIKDKSMSWINENMYLATFVLTEPFELTRGYKVQPCVFQEKKYTLKDIFDRLIFLSRFEFKHNFDNVNKINNKINFSSTNLYLAITEIARMYDSIPYFEYSDDDIWELKFQPLSMNDSPIKELENIAPNYQEQIKGDSVAKKVYMEGKNISSDVSSKTTSYSLFTTDNQPTIKKDASNLALFLPNGVGTLNSITFRLPDISCSRNEGGSVSRIITGYSDVVVSDNISNPFKRISVGNPQTTTWFESDIGGTFRFLSETNYNSLTEEEKTNNSIYYIYYNDNMIFLTDLKKLYNQGQMVCLDLPDDWNTGVVEYPKVKGVLFDNRDMSSSIQIWDAIFLPIIQQKVNTIIPMIIRNKNEYEDTVFYNQTSEIINPTTSVKVLQSYINSMESHNKIIECVYSDWDQIAREGQRINHDGLMLVNSVSIEQHQEYCNVVYNLVSEKAKKREYMEADSDVVVYAIDPKELIDTLYLDNKIFELSIDSYEPFSGLVGNDYEFYNDDYVSPELASLIIKRDTRQTDSGEVNMYNDIKNMIIQLGSIDAQPIIFVAENNIFFNLRCYSNMIYSFTADSEGHVLPVYYTDNSGIIQSTFLTLGFWNNDNGTKTFRKFYQMRYDPTNLVFKDKYETLNYTLQLSYIGTNGLEVYQGYTDYLSSVNLSYDAVMQFYDHVISTHNLSSPSTTIKARLRFSRDYNSLHIQPENDDYSFPNSFRSFAVLIDDELAFIQNYQTEKTNSNNDIKINIKIKDGLPKTKGLLS